MAYYDAELQDLYEKVARKRRLSVILQDLAKQEESLQDKIGDLKAKKDKEQADVDKLEGRSLAAFFYGVVGKKEGKLDKEREEAYAAAVKYDAAVKTLESVEQEIEKGEAEMSTLQNCEMHYERMLEEKAEAIKELEKPESAKILKIEERISYIKNQKREISEAYGVGEKARSLTQNVLTDLDSAEGWGTWDLMGGGIVSDMAKHGKLDEAQTKVEQLQVELRRYKTELADVTLQTDIKVNIDGFMRFADYFFDGVFADWAVLDKITSAKNQIYETLDKIKKIQNQLKSMEEEATREQTGLENELNDLIRNTSL